MTAIVLYHHVQGLTEGVRSFADELRQAGHTVHTPDLFDGRTFDTIEDGMAFAREAGFGALGERGVAAAEGIAPEAVYAGFSFGVMIAQQLAQTRPGARGALLMYSCLPVSEYGDAWPEGVPVQVHGKDGDPFFAEDLEAAQALVDSTDRPSCSSTRETNTSSPTPRYRPTTPPLRRCSASACWRSLTRSRPTGTEKAAAGDRRRAACSCGTRPLWGRRSGPEPMPEPMAAP
jgi:pimeloyl-ACP methyl ester carboxylesterase